MNSPTDEQRALMRRFPVRPVPLIGALVFACGSLVMIQDAGRREAEPLRREHAVHELTQRGATVVESFYSAGPDAVLVSFPLGESDRRAARTGLPPFRCVISIRRYNEPAAEGPPMTDADLDLLLDIPDLQRVDLGGTAVTNAGINSLRDALPGVEIAR